MQELLNKRTYNSKLVRLEPGEKYTEIRIEGYDNTDPLNPKVIYAKDAFGKDIFDVKTVLENGLDDKGKRVYKTKKHVGHIHYKGTDGEFKDVDFALEDMGAYWQMVKASYKLLIAKDFGANKLIKFQNKYRGANHEIIYEPRMLAWVNKTDLSDFQVFRNQQSVTGYITGEDNNVIRYDNAFGNGLHFEITLLRSGFKKEIVIEAKNKLELPPTANHKLVALFEYSGTGLKVKSKDKLREWTSGNYFEEQDGFRIQEEANEVYQSFIRPAYIIDDGAEQPTQELIKVFWKQHNGKLFQAKVLPKAFLLSASYPVRADTTTSFYSDADPGTTTTDGFCDHNGTSWSTVRNASTGTRGITNSYRTIVQTNFYLGVYYINRAFSLFDTSTIGSSSTISSAEIRIAHEGAFSNVDSDTLHCVAASPASNTELGEDDYSQVGSTSFGSIALSSWDTTVGNYNHITLNSSGISAINKAGISKFGFIMGTDLNDSAPTGDSNRVRVYHAEETGTSKDPYLEVTYSEAAASTWTPKIIIF